MENSSPLILEISSDEEVGFGDTRKSGGYGVGGGGFGDRDDCDWLSEILGKVDGNKDDDSDDVVWVSETFTNPPKKSRLEPSKPSAKVVRDESDDDDCVVLEGDPDEPMVAANLKVDDGGGGDDDDDVEIVGEKGEVACRDFPHARHLCAKFLFASTPHEVHCGQCHCYVCDSLAPCSHWGTGVSSIDHCHATDKDEYWRTERKRMKNGDKPVPAIPSINNTSHLRAFFQPTQVPSLAPPRPNPFLQNHILCPVTAHLSSMSSSNQGGAHPSGCAIRPVPVYRPRSQLSHVFKRSGLVGASSPNNSHLYRSKLSKNPLKRCRVLQTPVLKHSVQHVNSPQSINVGRANYVPSHTQMHSPPYSIHHQTRPHSQPYVNTNFVSAAPLHPHVASQPSVGPHVFPPKSYIPSQTVSSYQPDAGNAIGSELDSIFTMPSNQNAGNNPDNQSFQPQVLFDISNDFQQGNHTQNGIDDFGLAWDSCLIPGNVQMHGEVLQCQSAAPVDNSQLHSVKENDHRQSIEPVDNYQQQGVVLADNPSVRNDAVCQFTESIPPDTLDFQFDSWMFENHSLPGVSEVPVSPLWNAYSPEPASVDTGSLFDF